MSAGVASGQHGGRWQATLIFAYLALTAAVTGFLFLFFDMGAVFWGSPKPRVAATMFVGVMFVVMAGFSWLLHRPAMAWPPRATLIAGAVASAACIAAIANLALLRFPNSGDEYAYQFQAWTFAAGRLWNPAPSFGDLVTSTYVWIAEGKWVGQYPPGWPLAVAGAASLGIPPWALNTIFLIATGALLFAVIRRVADERAATIGCALFLLSPFSIFNAASFFSHVMAGFLVLLACWSMRVAITRGRLGFMVLTGAAIGLLGITRTNSAMIVALPIGAALLVRLRWRHLIALGLGGAPFLAGLLIYQQAITGDPFRPVYYLSGRTVDHLYFDVASIRTGLGLTIGKAMETCLWISPLVLPLWLVALCTQIRDRTFDAADAIYPLAILIFTFYPLDPGDRYGPRYYFEFWPLMIATIAAAAHAWPIWLRRYAAAAAGLTIAYGIILLPFLARDYHRIVVERSDPNRQAAALGAERAVVCIAGRSGLRPMFAPDLARNGITTDNPVLFAHCEKITPAQARSAFPGRRIYYYERQPGQSTGRLVPDAPSASAR